MPFPGKPAIRRTGPGNRILALLGGLCLFFSLVEYLIPKPLPFMRIGLANLPLLLALDLFPAGEFALLVLIKVLGQGIVSGTLFSYVFLFSLAGTAVSACAMYGLRKFFGVKRTGFAGIGTAGAFLSNAVQLVLARYVVFGPAVRYLVPPFLAAGIISGFGLGLFCGIFAVRSRWYRMVLSGEAAPAADAAGDKIADAAAGAKADSASARRDRARLKRRENWDGFFPAGDLFIAGFLMMCFFLFNSSVSSRFLQFLLFSVLAFLSGKKNNPLVALFVMSGVVFFNLLAPYGRVLFEWGPFRITGGALLAGLRRAVTLEGLLMLSGACIRPGLALPGRMGALLAESFGMLGALQKQKAALKPGRIIEGIDKLLWELEPLERPGTSGGRHAGEIVLLALMVSAAAVLRALTASGFWQDLRWLPYN
ncbi:MAG: Gx transporter family protein [Treponema sp.]|jgi:heptaprenyl diphosphate synthase|nr:Gx transporter family protein [Treponema sp.]